MDTMEVNKFKIRNQTCKECGHPYTDDVCCSECMDYKIDSPIDVTNIFDYTEDCNHPFTYISDDNAKICSMCKEAVN